MDTGWRRKVGKAAGGIALTACIAWTMDRWSLGVAIDTYLFSYGFWIQSAVIALVALATVVLTSRPCLTLLLSASLLGLIYVVNYFKICYLISPLTLADYFLVRDLDAEGLSLFAHYANICWVFFGLAVFTATCALVLRWEPPLFRGKLLLRSVTFVLVMALLLVGVRGEIGERLFSVERLNIVVFSPIASQLRAGLISHLVYSARSMAGAFDEPVDRRAVQRLLASVRPRQMPKAAGDQLSEPDVVIIQSESFFDPGVIEQVGDTSSLLPNLHRALEHGDGGHMIVPTFGGGTIRTEFEVLTGIPLAAYSRVQFPYLQLAEDRVPSVAHTFSKAGYETIAVHGNSGTFWSRHRALHVLGFDRFLTAADFGSDALHDGAYLSDRSMTDEVIAQLAQPGRPRFIFAISIEAHGPFGGVPVKDERQRDHIARPSAFSDDAADEYSRYAYHIAHADREFGRLWEYLEKRGRPYVLVFYGDHLPAFRYVYGQATFRNGLSARAQEVPWVAVGSGVPVISRQDIYAWMLPGEVLGLSGVTPSAYMALAAAAGRNLLTETADTDGRREGLYSAARLNLHEQFYGFESVDGSP